MYNQTGSDSAMDLSLRNPVLPSTSSSVNIVKPIPRPPWSIVWYRNLWSLSDYDALRSETFPDTEIPNSSNVASFSSPLSTIHSFKSNTTGATKQDSYNNFPPSRFVTNQSQSHDEDFRNDDTFVQKSSNFMQYSFRYKTNSQENLVNCHREDKRVDSTGIFSNNRIQDSSYETIVSVDEEDQGNESENSENIVVTTVTTNDTTADNLTSLHETCNSGNLTDQSPSQSSVILDVACCDGPVQFKRISNPNFAVTVEHNEVCTFSSTSVLPETGDSNAKTFSGHSKLGKCENKRRSQSTSSSGNMQMYHHGKDKESSCVGGGGITTLKSYLCIYCNQSFKSLFCYQKHKKRHLNPVSVDITTTMENSTSQPRPSHSGTATTTIIAPASTTGSREGVVRTCGSSNNNNNNNNSKGSGGVSNGGGVVGITPDNTKAKTKDLNVQFFPCKKCGSKFPSYYFVHKHRKICH